MLACDYVTCSPTAPQLSSMLGVLVLQGPVQAKSSAVEVAATHLNGEQVPARACVYMHVCISF